MSRVSVFDGRPSQYISWERVKIERQLDLTYKLSVPGVYWEAAHGATWAVFSREIDGVIRQTIGAEGLERVTFRYAKTTSSPRCPAELGELAAIGTLDWVGRLMKLVPELAIAIDKFADECGARAAALDEQDRAMSTELGAAFRAHSDSRPIF